MAATGLVLLSGLLGCGSAAPRATPLPCLSIQPAIYEYVHDGYEPPHDRAVVAPLLAAIDRYGGNLDVPCPTHPLKPLPASVPRFLTHPLCRSSDTRLAAGAVVHELTVVPAPPPVRQEAVLVWSKLKRTLSRCPKSG